MFYKAQKEGVLIGGKKVKAGEYFCCDQHLLNSNGAPVVQVVTQDEYFSNNKAEAKVIDSLDNSKVVKEDASFAKKRNNKK